MDDPESDKLAFTFRNMDASLDMLRGSPDPSCFMERVQLFANGQRVETAGAASCTAC